MLQLEKDKIDLKLKIWLCSGHSSENNPKGMTHEYRQNDLLPNRRFYSNQRISQMCGTIQGQLQGPKFFMLGSISM